MKALLPVTIVLGTFAALVLASHAAVAKTAPVTEPLQPGTPPLLPTLPGQTAPANIDVLRAQLGDLLAQARAAPATVDPNALGALAAQLQQDGLGPEAATVQAAAIQLAAARLQVPQAAPGGPPVVQQQGNAGNLGAVMLDPRTPSALPIDMQNQSVFFLTDDRSDPAAVRALARRIEQTFPGSFLTQVSELDRRAAQLAARRGE